MGSTRRYYWLASLLALHATTWLVALSRPASVAAQQTAEQRIVHLLNRLGYGPRVGDIEKVKSMGIEAYIDWQLKPDQIPDGEVEAKLAQAYGPARQSLQALMENDRPAAGIAVRRREPVVGKAYNAESLRADSAGTEVDADSSAAIRRGFRSTAGNTMVTRADRPGSYFNGGLGSRLVRAVYSDRQLQEAMVDFWFNHFNIRSGDPYQVNHWTDQVIRPNALGRFEDLLVATATHPAMMIYLDNWMSAAPDSVIKSRLEKWQPPAGENRELAVRRRSAFFAQTKGLNENYARELMELHTLGVDGGYTQKDVVQVARAFTGWTISGPREDGAFHYEPLIHEEGDKVVLGRTIKSGGLQEGREILRLLAHHPSTARFISFKLARRFIADNPPESVVEKAAATFTASGGDVAAVLRTIFTSPEFSAPEYYQNKIKKPVDMVISALRAVSAEIDLALEGGLQSIDRTLNQMGERLGDHLAPDGYPEIGSAWVSTNTLYQRMSFALSLTSGQIPGVRPRLDAAAALLREMGYGDPTAQQIAQARTLLARRTNARAGGAGGMMTEGQTDMMGKGMGSSAAAAAPPTADELKAIATAIHLGSPSFQKR